jgi:glycerol-3-phosphate dehydrogenase
MVKEMVGETVSLDEKDTFIPERQGRVGTFSELSPEEKADLVATEPDYGEIVCRCEQITKKEILDAIENPLGNRTIAGIKYRARAMMGRCQGGFCLPRIVEILEKEFGYNPEDFIFNRPDSRLFSGRVR